MTRETKIGLLVGLAFIIVIGILLSDYNRLETQQAPLYGTMRNVQESTAAPGAADARNGEIAVVPPPSRQAAPRQPVPLRDEVNGSRNDKTSSVIVVRAGTSNPLPPDDHPRTGDADSSGDDNGSQVVVGPGNQTPSNTDSPDSHGVPRDLTTAANENHEQLVPVGGRTARNTPGSTSGNTARDNATVAEAGQHYTAVSGDTLSKLAGRFMGGNTKANRDAIVKANPSLQKNPNTVVVGRAYIIPTGSAPVATATIEKLERSKPTPAVAMNDRPAISGAQYWYTVKENDSLWKIAQEQLGDGNAWAAIKELNKDLLKGKEDVRPNMRLKMPAKPLASAS